MRIFIFAVLFSLGFTQANYSYGCELFSGKLGFRLVHSNEFGSGSEILVFDASEKAEVQDYLEPGDVVVLMGKVFTGIPESFDGSEIISVNGGSLLLKFMRLRLEQDVLSKRSELDHSQSDSNEVRTSIYELELQLNLINVNLSVANLLNLLKQMPLNVRRLIILAGGTDLLVGNYLAKALRHRQSPHHLYMRTDFSDNRDALIFQANWDGLGSREKGGVLVRLRKLAFDYETPLYVDNERVAPLLEIIKLIADEEGNQ